MRAGRIEARSAAASMSENLVIVESPAKARTIKKYLGKDFEVLASYGHVRDLVPKEGAVDPDHGFGRPRFAHGGAAVDDVIDLFRAGEPVDAVAEEFGLSRNEVEDAIRVATRASA